MPGLPSSGVRVFLLGGFEVARHEKVVRPADWTRRKAQMLLARLALEPGRRLLKDQALDLLWPDQPAAAASNNLYRTLHALRQTLDTVLGPGSAEATFVFEDGVLALQDAVWVDVAQFQQLCSTLASPERRLANLEQALDGEVDPRLTSAIYETTEGNPFFVAEVIRSLLKAGQARKERGMWGLVDGAELRVPAG